MPANDTQVGGEHYKAEYQHWDFVTDIRLPYIPAVATKYIMRHRKKDGEIGLSKAIHCLDKAIEIGCRGSIELTRFDKFWRFVIANELTLMESAAICYIMEGQFEQARVAVWALQHPVA